MAKKLLSRDDVHKIICSILKDYNLSNGQPNTIRHFDERIGQMRDDPVSIEAELIFAIEYAFEIGAQSVRENKSVREILDGVKYGI